MIRRASGLTLAFALFMVQPPSTCVARGVEQCDTDSTTGPPQGFTTFYPRRFGVFGEHVWYRDVELLLDALYAPSVTALVDTTLKRFAIRLTDSVGTSPLATDARNVQAVSDYLNPHGLTWSDDPQDLGSMRMGRGQTESYPLLDRSHVDAYIAHPGHGTGGCVPFGLGDRQRGQLLGPSGGRSPPMEFDQPPRPAERYRTR